MIFTPMPKPEVKVPTTEVDKTGKPKQPAATLQNVIDDLRSRSAAKRKRYEEEQQRMSRAF